MTPSASSTDSSDPACRILLVDDNPTNLQVLSKILDGRGYELLIAVNGDMALNIARKARPALVLLDIMMPERDGFEVCRRLKADDSTRETAVIFLSALGDTKDKVQGLQLGAVDYITKPFQADEVLARVNTHLTLYRLQRSLSERNQQLAAINERTTRDLHAAARVQRALLPERTVKTSNSRFAWIYRPCDELAGDALNVFALDDRHIAMFVLDVSGHGVVASLLAVAISHALTPRVDNSSLVTNPGAAESQFIVPPAEVVGRLNRMFPMKSDAAQFATLLYGVLDTQTGLFRFTAAGHPGPVVAEASQTFAVDSSQGLPIGVVEDTVYSEASISLEFGTRITLFTDGLPDQASPSGELFGTRRLVDTIDSLKRVSIAEYVGQLERRLLAWGDTDHLGDDLSILAFERANLGGA